MATSMGTTGKLVAAFVTLLIGVILIGTVATEGLDKTDTIQITDEAVDISSARTLQGDINATIEFTIANPPEGTWKQEDCPITSFVIGNSSEDYTVTTDYVFYTAYGNFSLVNSTTTRDGTNSTLVDYYYCGDDYMNLTWGRTGIDLIPGFFALAILLTSVGLFYSVGKDYGII